MGLRSIALVAGGVVAAAVALAAPANAADATDSANVDVTCALPVLATNLYQDWPVTLTVSPAAGAPGSTATVSVAVGASPVNSGPTTLTAGSFRMEAAVTVNGVASQLIGPTTAAAAAPLTGPFFGAAQLPTVATGSVTLPAAPGTYPVALRDIYYNNVTGTGTASGLDDIFDYRCNASLLPRVTPTAFTEPSVSVTVGEENEIPVGAVGGLGATALLATVLGLALLRPRRRSS